MNRLPRFRAEMIVRGSDPNACCDKGCGDPLFNILDNTRGAFDPIGTVCQSMLEFTLDALNQKHQHDTLLEEWAKETEARMRAADSEPIVNKDYVNTVFEATF